MRYLAVLCLALAVSGCVPYWARPRPCPACPTPEPVIQTVTVSRPCLKDLPQAPGLPVVGWAECEGFEACLSLEDAHRLASWISAVLEWQRLAWVACGDQN